MHKSEVTNFLEEIEDIIDTIGKVKGDSYKNALLIIVNTINTSKVMAMMSEITNKDAIDTLCKMEAGHTTDVFYRLSTMLSASNDAIVITKKMEELKADVFSILNKQDEYSTKGK